MGCMSSKPFLLVFTCTDKTGTAPCLPTGVSAGLPKGWRRWPRCPCYGDVLLHDWASVCHLGLKPTIVRL